MTRYACVALALLAWQLAAPLNRSAGAAPAPATLLLTPADLPPGYVRDDALENADATTRSRAYSAIIASSAFIGYRTARAATVHYVARLRRRADAATFLSGEDTAAARSHGVDPLTLPSSFGRGRNVVFQARGTHGQEWVELIFADGPYVTVLATYDASGEQTAIDTLQRLGRLVDARLRAAATRAPDVPPAPALRVVTLRTTTASGGTRDRFTPGSTIYFQLTWWFDHPPAGRRETVRVQLSHGHTLLYRNALTDRAFAGANTLADHIGLHGVAAGPYVLAVSITLGHLSAQATHRLIVSATP